MNIKYFPFFQPTSTTLFGLLVGHYIQYIYYIKAPKQILPRKIIHFQNIASCCCFFFYPKIYSYFMDITMRSQLPLNCYTPQHSSTQDHHQAPPIPQNLILLFGILFTIIINGTLEVLAAVAAYNSM